MQFKKELLKILRLPKVKAVSKLLLVNFIVLLLFGFNGYDTDSLYLYQWGLKNNGNFLVGKEVLKSNFEPLYFDKGFNDNIFFDNDEVADFFKTMYVGMGVEFSNSAKGCDIVWEEGYNLFKENSFGRDVIVAIIDTGIDISHFELSDNIWKNVNEIPGNGVDDDMNGYIDDVNGYNFNGRNANVMPEVLTEAHGTHAAGIIAASHYNGGIKGIANDSHVKIMPLKVLDSKENGYMSSVIEAINYAKINGAKICNISLGTYSYDSTIDYAIKNNPDMLFVVSAGNGMNFIGYSLDERDVYPAKLEYPNVITVSNISFNGERYESANYGSYVDIFAPGTFILSTVPGNSFAYLTGTSMSSPFVSAVCAMIYSRYPNVPIYEIKNVIINGATPMTNLLGLSKNAGMLNVYNSLLLAGSY